MRGSPRRNSPGRCVAEYAEEYRDWAGQCFAMACPTEDAEGKAEWLELALKWQRVAKQADRYAQERGENLVSLTQPPHWRRS
jgi:hypothetical protein